MDFNKIDGVINIFKEPNYTSHDIVAILRRILRTKKVGHAGTLDPNASGVLPICVGKGTKISSYLMDFKKTYIAEITFGIETDTEDIWGNILEINDSKVNMGVFKDNLYNYNNIEIKQIPPMYSAIKVNGNKLYELARKGINIERKERKVYIYSTRIIREYNNKIILEIECSKGTYIRTFIKDLCRQSNTIGVMSNLLRIRSGGMNLKDSLTISQIEYLVNKKNINFFSPIEEALSNMNKVNIDSRFFNNIINGVKIKINKDYSDELFRIYCSDIFIGIGYLITENNNNYIKIKNNFYRDNNENN